MEKCCVPSVLTIVHFSFEKWTVDGPIWFRTNTIWLTRPPKWRTLIFYHCSIALRIRSTRSTKDGCFRLSGNLFSFLLIEAQKSFDDITTPTIRRSWKIWQRNVFRSYIVSMKFPQYSWTLSMVRSLLYVPLPTFWNIGIIAHLSCRPAESTWPTCR